MRVMLILQMLLEILDTAVPIIAEPVGYCQSGTAQTDVPIEGGGGSWWSWVDSKTRSLVPGCGLPSNREWLMPSDSTTEADRQMRGKLD
jgi:hypothetical protein